MLPPFILPKSIQTAKDGASSGFFHLEFAQRSGAGSLQDPAAAAVGETQVGSGRRDLRSRILDRFVSNMYRSKAGKKKNSSCCAFIRMKKSNKRLELQNDLLQLKNEILFDMQLVESNARIHLQRTEIEQLKRCLAISH